MGKHECWRGEVRVLSQRKEGDGVRCSRRECVLREQRDRFGLNLEGKNVIRGQLMSSG